MLLVRNVHAHAVDLHTVVGGNEQISVPANHAGLDEVAVLRCDGDLEFLFSNHPEKGNRFFEERDNTASSSIVPFSAQACSVWIASFLHR